MHREVEQSFSDVETFCSNSEFEQQPQTELLNSDPKHDFEPDRVELSRISDDETSFEISGDRVLSSFLKTEFSRVFLRHSFRVLLRPSFLEF